MEIWKLLSETVTDNQLTEVTNLLIEKLRKHKGEFPSVYVKSMIERKSQLLAEKLFAVIRNEAEENKKIIVRTVEVHDISVEEIMHQIKHSFYLTVRGTVKENDVPIPIIIETMPRGIPGKTEFVFFKPDNVAYVPTMSTYELEQFYEYHGCEPADPYLLLAFHKANPLFATERRVMTFWKDSLGRPSGLLLKGDEKHFFDYGFGHDDWGYYWRRDYWYPGIPKKK